MQTKGSRRQFVGGAVATGAAIGGLALFGRGKDGLAETDGVRVVSGRPAPVAIDATEVERWTAIVGRAVSIDGEGGATTSRVESVLRYPAKDRRPAGVRPQGFRVTLLADRVRAPKGDAIYAIDHAIEGLSRVFLTRGPDRGMQALLFADFN